MGGLLPNVSTFGPAVDFLFRVVLVVTGAAFVLVEGLLVYFLIRYRSRPGQKATYVHGNRNIEIAWTVIPGPLLHGDSDAVDTREGAWLCGGGGNEGRMTERCGVPPLP